MKNETPDYRNQTLKIIVITLFLIYKKINAIDIITVKKIYEYGNTTF